MTTFDWCVSGRHDQCIREFQRWAIDLRTRKMVLLDETVTCGCRKRGCKCYIKPADRPKRKNSRRK